MDQEHTKTLDQKIESLKNEFIEKQKEQLQSENQKLMNYITVIREDKKKKSFWNKLFYK
ncbi:hypothetical protein IZY60_04605 [Lutibacter sp. B2]|nr:hypothetical protein [Lutibacter sp. B2]